MHDVKDLLSKSFSMKYLGEASYILRLNINRDKSKHIFSLNKNIYIDKGLNKFNMNYYKNGLIPLCFVAVKDEWIGIL